jgi:hypothetical protein
MGLSGISQSGALRELSFSISASRVKLLPPEAEHRTSFVIGRLDLCLSRDPRWGSSREVGFQIGLLLLRLPSTLQMGLQFAVYSFAAETPYCISVNGGFGNSGGTTFVARNFTLPEASKCTPWSGYTKTATTVILTTSGTSCLSSDNKVLTISVSSAAFLFTSEPAVDYIQLSRGDATEPFTGQGRPRTSWTP